ncbi:hypothetical protein [Sphingomonas sp.]|uniref:hypothetical protein n=1 Tax=Sphingomonas sp. TaxID=28214 RepID=UPI002E0D7796|nr:hypothetical protein [Sphingomonas sp.]
MNLRLLIPATAGLLVSACDPGVHVGWEKDFSGRVDSQCVEQALQTVASEVSRATYVSEGGRFARGFPRGTEVTQFNYFAPPVQYGYSLDLALLPNGKTHVVHRWSKIGTDIPHDEQTQVLPLLLRANKALETACGLEFAGSEPEVGPG